MLSSRLLESNAVMQFLFRTPSWAVRRFNSTVCESSAVSGDGNKLPLALFLLALSVWASMNSGLWERLDCVWTSDWVILERGISQTVIAGSWLKTVGAHIRPNWFGKQWNSKVLQRQLNGTSQFWLRGILLQWVRKKWNFY